ncbi:MAG: lyase [Candidatus Koribacter versatilis]|uniref:Virginiamycin B lyase n=1 Tax=Candidatus Korobacter versatilis TaxID=658062 RepID=A0A932A6X3_9BACT|nr:lyase [Candidatus Koribacter versatilis]
MTKKFGVLLRSAAAAVVCVASCAGAAFAQHDGQKRALTANDFKLTRFPLKSGMGNRDVAPAPDGTVWFSNQFSGSVGNLDPKTGKYVIVLLGRGSSPHGMVMGPDGNLWVMDGGQEAIVRVDSSDHKLTLFRMPKEKGDLNLNTGVFDHKGAFWFTGQNGFYGRLDPATEKIQLWRAPKGFGPYGITVTPQGTVWYTNFAANHLVGIDPATFKTTVVELPYPSPTGARRVWSDSQGNLWLGTWASGELLRYSPAAKSWTAYKLPGWGPRAYSTYVDEDDIVWVSDFTANAVLRFDPKTQSWVDFPGLRPQSQVLEMNGRPGQAWGSEQGSDLVFVIEKK